MAEEGKAAGPKRGNFIAEGWRELRRKWHRSRLRGDLRRHDIERTAALTGLGQRAWDEKIDLAAFPQLRDQLAGLDARAGEISATSSRLESEKATLEADKRAQLDAFGARRKAVAEKKTPVDAALRAARAKKSAGEQAVRQAEARVASIVGKLAALDREIAAATAPAEKLAAAQAERARLAAEQAEQAAAAVRERGALPETTAEEARLAGESSQYAAQIAAIDAEQKAAIGHLDSELARLRKEAQAASQQASVVQKDRAGNLASLGRALYDAKIDPPALVDATARVAAIDAARAAAEATLAASLVESRAVESGTLAKFWLVVAGVPLLLAAVVLGSMQYLRRPAAAPASVAASAPATDPDSCARPGPREGEGVAITESCTRLEGSFIEGRLHGKGRMEWKNGELMEGRFANGVLTGPGVRVYPGGRRAEAFFVDARAIGHGKLTLPDGTVYEGQLSGPAILGWAVRRGPGGEVVAGDWRPGADNKIEPIGTMLRVRDGKREKVHASAIDPAVAAPSTPPADAPAPATPDPKRY